MFLKKHKGKILSLLIIFVLLVFAYCMGSEIWPQKETKNPEQKQLQIQEESQEIIQVPDEKPEEEENEQISSAETASEEDEETADRVLQGMKINKETGMDEYQTQPVPEGKPLPIEPQTVTISDKEMSCTLTIRCDTLLNNLDKLEEAKWMLIPKDGVILAEKTVTFYEGESVFNVLLRETRKNGIHMEYVSTPIYNSAYIEGIHNLYEFDCGELSGWMYSVNGWFPNYGSSRYGLKEGDRIEWVFTCALGKDVK